MAYISALKSPDNTTYNIKSYKTQAIPTGAVAGTSTSTAYTATVDGITSLYSGVCCYLKNGQVTSASGATLNINSLGAKPIYLSNEASTGITTEFGLNVTGLFVYNADRVSGGCWDFIASGDEQVQSDWAENDSTDPAYIQNRTHYRELTDTPGLDLSAIRGSYSEADSITYEGYTYSYVRYRYFDLSAMYPDYFPFDGDTITEIVDIVDTTAGTAYVELNGTEYQLVMDFNVDLRNITCYSEDLLINVGSRAIIEEIRTADDTAITSLILHLPLKNDVYEYHTLDKNYLPDDLNVFVIPTHYDDDNDVVVVDSTWYEIWGAIESGKTVFLEYASDWLVPFLTSGDEGLYFLNSAELLPYGYTAQVFVLKGDPEEEGRIIVEEFESIPMQTFFVPITKDGSYYTAEYPKTELDDALQDGVMVIGVMAHSDDLRGNVVEFMPYDGDVFTSQVHGYGEGATPDFYQLYYDEADAYSLTLRYVHLPTSLSELNGIWISSPSNGQVLTYNSSYELWVNSNPPTGSLSGLSDTTITSAANGQILKYDSTSSKWVNANEVAVPSASSATPLVDGTGAAGSSTDYSRADHVHPKITQTLSISNNVITLTGSDSTTSSVTLPVYNGSVTTVVSGGDS